MKDVVSEDFMAELYRLAFINRYNTHQRIKDESVATHSYYVVLFTKLICDKFGVSSSIKLAAMELAVAHDIPEIVTNDITYDAKQVMPEIKPILKRYEMQYIECNFPELYDIMYSDGAKSYMIQKIVSLADILSVVQYLNNEVMLGNEKFKRILVEAKQRFENAYSDLERMLLNAKE